ncbi:MAG TPA: hypothetical protein DSN98_03175 [Thermoplasmata archaeon]|jgi:hypothetical protein|nr:MAG TPA: hypothetical protein DSN98_03175 [Thermoplasmata archaeon]
MKKKILGIFVGMLLIATAVPAIGSQNNTLKNATTPSIAPPGLRAEWTQAQKLLASDGTFGDCLGYSVSLDGDTALIGAFNDNADADLYGSVYIFTRSGTTWTQQAKLIPTAGGYYDYFGYAVSLDGDTALIGAPGNSFNPIYPGAAYVFTRTGTTWTQQARLDPSDGQDGDYFGNSVALDGDTAIIGSEYFSGTGSAYVFTRSGITWTQQTKLIPPDGFNGELFGLSVSVEGNTALIGALLDDDNGPGSGSAYVFSRSGTTWTQQAKLLATDGASLDSFGISVALFGDNALIGAEWDNDNGEKSGSAYVFTRAGATWTQQAKLLPSDGTTQDLFGHSVSLANDTALIGANEDDATGNYSGSAYLFTRSGTTWTQQEKLLPADPTEQKLFGESVSLDGDTALIGAYGDGTNGPGSGSTYVFTKAPENQPPETPTIQGQTNGKIKRSYTYTFVSTDPDGDDVFYCINWSDGTGETCIGPYDSGKEVKIAHIWTEKGTFIIKAKAQDGFGGESHWGTLSVTMPCSYTIPLIRFWEQLFVRFPEAFPILRHLMGY